MVRAMGLFLLETSSVMEKRIHSAHVLVMISAVTMPMMLV